MGTVPGVVCGDRHYFLLWLGWTQWQYWRHQHWLARLHPMERLYQNMLDLLATQGCPRHPAQTPLEYAYHMWERQPVNRAEAIADISHAYVRWRYGDETPDSTPLAATTHCSASNPISQSVAANTQSNAFTNRAIDLARTRPMDNPFPGMNPYLENSSLWHQVHNRLIVAIADALTLQIAPTYRVSIEERIYTTMAVEPLVGIADVAVSPRNRGTTTLLAARLQEPTKVRVPLPEEVTERFLEVRVTQTGAVVTAIEILSPKNKQSTEGREAYDRKRIKILGSLTSLVEIDLLRSGTPMFVEGDARSDYRILISRGFCRPDADLYAFNLPEPIPNFPVPLRQGEPEPIVDLQQLLNDVYRRARFDLFVEEKGRREGKEEVARNLLSILDDETIARTSGLPIEEVRAMRQNRASP
ncbi:MAG: DUF4058 family protein [Coleofasciculaceae cyanobacterium SM2_3_26]|nr:DUF4058 family protein [Coleofasciculaceae cyanobacterium SM2_3_26]